MNKQYYIGLDVHKDTIAIAYISSSSCEDAIYHGTSGGSSEKLGRFRQELCDEPEG